MIKLNVEERASILKTQQLRLAFGSIELYGHNKEHWIQTNSLYV